MMPLEKRAEWAEAHASPVSSVTMTQQQFAQELDINSIMRRFQVTGMAPLGVPGGVYGDFTGIEDWESAVAKVEKATADFMKLPPELREQFGNSPGGLIAYARSHTYEEYLEDADAIADRLEARIASVAAEKAAALGNAAP